MVYRQSPSELRPVGTACPRCHAVLRDKKIAGLRVRECGGCWGVWLDSGDYRTAGQDEAVQAALAGVTGRDVAGAPGERLRCPFCERLMRRRLFRKQSGVTIDECQRHGVWFDVDELRQGFGFAVAQTRAKAAAKKPVPKVRGGKPVKIETGGVSGEATLRAAVRLLWKALFGSLLASPKKKRR